MTHLTISLKKLKFGMTVTKIGHEHLLKVETFLERHLSLFLVQSYFFENC